MSNDEPTNDPREFVRNLAKQILFDGASYIYGQIIDSWLRGNSILRVNNMPSRKRKRQELDPSRSYNFERYVEKREEEENE